MCLCGRLVDSLLIKLSPKTTCIGVAGDVGKFNELTKSMLMEEIMVPESRRASCVCYLFVLVLWNMPFVWKRLWLECAVAAPPSVSCLMVSLYFSK